MDSCVFLAVGLNESSTVSYILNLLDEPCRFKNKKYATYQWKLYCVQCQSNFQSGLLVFGCHLCYCILLYSYFSRIKTLDYSNCLVKAHRYLFQNIPTDQLRLKNVMSENAFKVIMAERDGFTAVAPALSKETNWAMHLDDLAVYRKWILEVLEHKDPQQETGEAPGIYDFGDSLSRDPCLLVDMDNTVTFLKVSCINFS